MDSMAPVLAVLAPGVPFVVVYLIGIILSAMKMSVYRRAASLALGGFIGLLLGQLVRVHGTLLMLPANRGSTPLRELATQLAMINLLGVLLALGGTILLLLAIFADRDKRPAHA